MTEEPRITCVQPVKSLVGHELLEEFHCLSKALDKRERCDANGWLFDRKKEVQQELDGRLVSHDTVLMTEEEHRLKIVRAFAFSIGAVHAAVWVAHGGRDLNDNEVRELTTVIFNFYLDIK